MDYNHSRKAGNRGDVWKHAILMMIADTIPIRNDEFHWLETHAGAPIHRLQTGGEWQRGIGSILTAKHLAYVARAADFVRNGEYPAGWFLAAERLLHRCERIVVTACDNSTAVAEAYADFQAPVGVTCDFLCADGYEEARNADADFVFLDPPFSSDSRQDWRDMAQACTLLGRKKIPFVVWYPCSGSSKPQELVDGTGCAALEVWWDEYAAPQSQSMKGCGMLVSPDLMSIMESAAGELGLLAESLRAQRWGVRYPSED